MQHYRFNKLYPDNSIRSRDEGYHLSDWHALLYAQRINADCAVDIFQGERRIATLPARQNATAAPANVRASGRDA